jgi:hypothetical protein
MSDPTAKLSLPADSAERLSHLRQLLREQLQDLQALAWKLGDSGPMVRGCYYQVYKTCTQPNCRCQKGHKHGPFPALSWSVDGKQRMVMVKAADVPLVERKATAYREYQGGLTRIRRVMSTIEELLGRIRSLLLEEYR